MCITQVACPLSHLHCLRGTRVRSQRPSSPAQQALLNQALITTSKRLYCGPQGIVLISRSRLFSEVLPDDPTLRLRLVEAFFDRSHPLRCLGFIHRPTFMQSLERDSVVQDYGQPLLYAICALGAR